MEFQTTGPKLMEYFNVYLEYEYFHDSASSYDIDVLRENFDENMQEFDSIVNSRLEEGWQLLGPPTFSKEWFDLSKGGIALQTLVREKNVDLALVVDVNTDVVVAECVKPLRASKRIAQSN